MNCQHFCSSSIHLGHRRMLRHIIISSVLSWCQEAQGLVWSDCLIFYKPAVNNILQLYGIHGSIIIVQTFPLQSSYKPLYKWLVFRPVRPCPQLGYSLRPQPVLRPVLVLASVVVHYRYSAAESPHYPAEGIPG